MVGTRWSRHMTNWGIISSAFIVGGGGGGWVEYYTPSEKYFLSYSK